MSNILELKNVNLFLGEHHKQVQILRDINLELKEKQSIALVGESGCGKTTLGKLIVNTLKPTSGEVLYRGKDINKLSKREYKQYRLEVQLIQQDSFASLNMNKNIYEILSYALIEHKLVNNKVELLSKITELLSDVGLVPVVNYLYKFPHQLSGGQRQRVLIARALSVKPKLIVADEPVSMVDASLRIAILRLMNDIIVKYGVSFVYITHDLATARYLSDQGKIVVMYLGQVIEIQDINFDVRQAKHPYFKALIAAIPDIKKDSGVSIPINSVSIPSLNNIPTGCLFNPRCIHSEETCTVNEQHLVKSSTYAVRCERIGKF